MHQSTFFILSQGEDLLAGLLLCKEQRQQGIFFYVHTHTCATGWLSAHQCTQPPIVNKRTRHDCLHGDGGDHPLPLGVDTAVSGCAAVCEQPTPTVCGRAARRSDSSGCDRRARSERRPCVTLDAVTRFTTVAALSLLLLLTSGGGRGESVDDEAVGKLFAEESEQFGRCAGAVGQLELL